jgi:hypothetical protein
MTTSAYFAIALFPFVFVAFWLGICWLISLSGWSQLSRHFKASEASSEAPAISFGMQSARLRTAGTIIPSANYRGALTIGCQPTGLRLSVMFLFRFGHPALLIPWSAIGQIEQKSALFGLSHYYSCPVLLPDGSNDVEIQLTDQRIAQAITSYQQLSMLGK